MGKIIMQKQCFDRHTIDLISQDFQSVCNALKISRRPLASTTIYLFAIPLIKYIHKESVKSVEVEYCWSKLCRNCCKSQASNFCVGETTHADLYMQNLANTEKRR